MVIEIDSLFLEKCQCIDRVDPTTRTFFMQQWENINQRYKDSSKKDLCGGIFSCLQITWTAVIGPRNCNKYLINIHRNYVVDRDGVWEIMSIYPNRSIGGIASRIGSTRSCSYIRYLKATY